MTKTKILILCLALLLILLLGCGTVGHAGLETGKGYSDIDNSSLNEKIEYWDLQAE